MRTAVPDDEHQLLDLLTRFAAYEGSGCDSVDVISIDRALFEAQLREAWVDAKHCRVLVAESHSRLEGFVKLRRMPSPSRTGWIEALVVRRDRWGQGIGSQLTNASIEWLAGEGVQRVEVTARADNDRARRFYSRLGFREFLVTAFKELSAEA